MIQGVAAVVTASIPAVDENVNYKALVECVFILNGEYFSACSIFTEAVCSD